MSLKGTPEDLSPAGILQLLASDARTGAVRFAGDAPCSVYLHEGQLYFATDADTDEALATALVRPGRLTADAWDQAVTGAGDRPIVGELLAQSGQIEPDLLASTLLSVAYDPLIALFRAGGGDFDFEADAAHWIGPIRAFPVDVIVTEVRRRVRETDEWASDIPSLDAEVHLCRSLPASLASITLTWEQWELVTALTVAETIDALAVELGRGRYSAARVVHHLSALGVVDVVRRAPGGDVVPLHRSEPPPASDDEWAGVESRHPEGGIFGHRADRDVEPESDVPQPPNADETIGDGGGSEGSGTRASSAPEYPPSVFVDAPPGWGFDAAPVTGSVIGQTTDDVDPDTPEQVAWLEDLYAKYMDEPGEDDRSHPGVRDHDAPAEHGSRAGPFHRLRTALHDR